MMTRDTAKSREQIQMMSLDDLVPADHLVRKLEAALDWSFIYDMVEEKYSEDVGRPSIDPVVLIKLPVIQYMFGLRSMRQTIRETEVNNAYRQTVDKVSQHFAPAGAKEFESLFPAACTSEKALCAERLYAGGVRIAERSLSSAKASAFVDALILSDDDEQEPPKPSGSGKANRNTSKKKQARRKKEKHVKVSNSDPDSGWFRKGEHKNVFAYSVQTACDANGVILGYSVHPGNENDGRTFPAVLEKVESLPVELVVGDTAYKTPAIAHLLKGKGMKLLSTYSRPKTKDGFFAKHEYVYDEYYDCYICPNNQILSYSTTNRDGYREYKSCGSICASCPYLAQCTHSKNHVILICDETW